MALKIEKSLTTHHGFEVPSVYVRISNQMHQRDAGRVVVGLSYYKDEESRSASQHSNFRVHGLPNSIIIDATAAELNDVGGIYTFLYLKVKEALTAKLGEGSVVDVL